MAYPEPKPSTPASMTSRRQPPPSMSPWKARRLMLMILFNISIVFTSPLPLISLFPMMLMTADSSSWPLLLAGARYFGIWFAASVLLTAFVIVVEVVWYAARWFMVRREGGNMRPGDYRYPVFEMFLKVCLCLSDVLERRRRAREKKWSELLPTETKSLRQEDEEAALPTPATRKNGSRFDN